MPHRRSRDAWPGGVVRLRRLAAASLVLPAVLVVACRSPEDGRPRGGGPGGDGGNYHKQPVHVPSKLDGTKQVPNAFGSY
jgi:hypothetical protein